MKNKFIRIISPISVFIAAALDGAVIYYGYYSVAKLRESNTFINVLFAIIVACSVALAVLYTREVFRHGIKFKENEFEITFLDENNIFSYSEIKSVQSFKDTKVSMRKNFVERYSKITLNLNDGSIAAIELGFTTSRKLKAIEKEINRRIKN